MSGRSEIARISDQLERSFQGEAWHGPSILEILQDVNPLIAAKRPIPGAHTIWELTLHVAGWDGVVLQRVRGEACMLDDHDNFPTVVDTSGSAWRETVEILKRNHHELVTEISAMPVSRLTETVPGKDYDFYFMLHGAVQHTLYHAGQMALLKKAGIQSTSLS